MVTAALIALSLQAAAAEVVEVPVCSLVTPRGDAVGFFLWTGDNAEEMNLSVTRGSPWPPGTVTATRVPTVGSSLRYAMGGRNGMELEMGSQPRVRRPMAATLFRMEGGQSTLPVAYGYCVDREIAAEAPAPGADRERIGADIPAFDPALWPAEDCGLILSDERRLRFVHRRTGDDRIRLESAALWPNRPAATAVYRQNPRDARIGMFGDVGEPQGAQVLITAGSRAATLVRFTQVDAAQPGLLGYGICGHSAIVGRPRP